MLVTPNFLIADLYLLLLVLFRIAGKRSLAQITTFDFVLLLIIGEASQQALTVNDYSMKNGILIKFTLVGIDIGMSFLKRQSNKLEKMIDSVPLIILEDGKVFEDRLKNSRIDEADILSQSRELRGLERLDQIK